MESFTTVCSQVLSESNVTIVPAKRYTSRGSVVAVHMSVDHKNRVFACVATVNVPLAVAFGLLDEVSVDVDRLPCLSVARLLERVDEQIVVHLFLGLWII